MITQRSCFKRGSLLIFAVWVLAFLSILTFGTYRWVNSFLNKTRFLERREILRTLVDSGANVALNFSNQSRGASASGSFDSFANLFDFTGMKLSGMNFPEGSFSIEPGLKSDRAVQQREKVLGILDEESKINLNSMESEKVMTRFLVLAAVMPEDSAAPLAASILDWIDSDEDARNGGAESVFYQTLRQPYNAKNAPLNSLEELLWVKGMTPEIFRRILPYATVNSSARININTSSALVLKVAGFTDNLIRQIQLYRAGQDGVERNWDDNSFKDSARIAEDLNAIRPLADEEKALIESILGTGLVTVSSNTFSATITATLSGNQSQALQLECIFTRSGVWLMRRENFVVLAKG